MNNSIKSIFLVCISSIFIPSLTIVAGYNDFTLEVCASVCPRYGCLSAFSFLDDNLNANGFFTKFIGCALIL